MSVDGVKSFVGKRTFWGLISILFVLYGGSYIYTYTIDSKNVKNITDLNNCYQTKFGSVLTDDDFVEVKKNINKLEIEIAKKASSDRMDRLEAKQNTSILLLVQIAQKMGIDVDISDFK